MTSPGNISCGIFQKRGIQLFLQEIPVEYSYTPSPMLGAWGTDINKTGRNTATMIPNEMTGYQ